MKNMKYEKMLKEKYNLKNKETIERLNKRIALGKARVNAKQDKNAARDKEYNAYVREENKKNPEKKIIGTHGGWKEGKKWCITKTEWQKKQEEKEANEKAKPEEPEKIKEEKAIIIYDGEEAEVYRAELEKHKYADQHKIIIAKIRSGQRKVKMQLKEYEFGKENKIVKIEGMEMRESEIIECAIANNTEVYSIVGFYEDEEEEKKGEEKIRKKPVKLSKQANEYREKIKRLPFTI